MTIEELMQAQKELNQKQQNDFIDKLADMVDNFVAKSNRKDYEPTDHERERFRQIHSNINDIIKRF